MLHLGHVQEFRRNGLGIRDRLSPHQRDVRHDAQNTFFKFALKAAHDRLHVEQDADRERQAR